MANIAVGAANLLIAMSPSDAELIDPVQPFTPTSKYFAQRGGDIVDGLSLTTGGTGTGKAVAGLVERAAEGAAKRALVAAANQAENSSGLTVAARALDKHSGRPGGSFPPLRGNVDQKNEAAAAFVRDAIYNPRSVRTELSRGGVEYRLSNGQGVRFNADGSFSGFLDPRK